MIEFGPGTLYTTVRNNLVKSPSRGVKRFRKTVHWRGKRFNLPNILMMKVGAVASITADLLEETKNAVL